MEMAQTMEPLAFGRYFCSCGEYEACSVDPTLIILS
jgi:hypothetical protein